MKTIENPFILGQCLRISCRDGHRGSSTAAKSVIVGQPTIICTIKNLEKPLSNQLFIRGSRVPNPRRLC